MVKSSSSGVVLIPCTKDHAGPQNKVCVILFMISKKGLVLAAAGQVGGEKVKSSGQDTTTQPACGQPQGQGAIAVSSHSHSPLPGDMTHFIEQQSTVLYVHL